MDVEQLFRKVADDYTGRAELVFAHPDGAVDVDFMDEDNVLRSKVKFKMVRVGDKEFVSVRDRQDKEGPEVLVSPIISAVIAVAVR